MKLYKYIPSALTLSNLAGGVAAILVADFYWSSLLILFSMLMDVLDGWTARLLDATSDLGKELDSLADLVSFGVAPASLYFLLAPDASYWHVIPCAILVVGSAMRLARFNLLPSQTFFSGLPTPATALFFVGLFLSYHFENEWVWEMLSITWLYWLVPAFFTTMMLSRLHMFSLKGWDRKLTKNGYQIVLFVGFIVLLMFDDSLALSLSVILFILLSALQSIRHKG